MDYLLIPKILFRDNNLKRMTCKSKVLYAFILNKFEKDNKVVNLNLLRKEINTNDMTEKVILRCLEELKTFELIDFDFSIAKKDICIKKLVIFD